MKKYNFSMAAIFIAISIWLIKTSEGYGNAVDGTAMGAGEWPTILAILLLILSGVLIIQTVIELIKEKNEKKNASTEEHVEEKKEKVIDFTGKGMIRVYMVVGVLAVFYALLKFFGFYIASAVAVPGILFIMGEKKWWKMIAITAGILLFVFLVFDLALSLTMPIGSVFR